MASLIFKSNEYFGENRPKSHSLHLSKKKRKRKWLKSFDNINETAVWFDMEWPINNNNALNNTHRRRYCRLVSGYHTKTYVWEVTKILSDTDIRTIQTLKYLDCKTNSEIFWIDFTYSIVSHILWQIWLATVLQFLNSLIMG